MKFELDLIRSTREAPLDDDPKLRRTNTAPLRKELREVTDAVIHDALLVNDLSQLVYLACAAMMVVADTLDQVSEEPDVNDFVAAAMESLQNARAVMDRGLMIHDWETARKGSVMLELAVRGVCAALSVPYDIVLRAAHTQGNAAVRGVLVVAGLIKETNEDTTATAEPIGDAGNDGDERDGAAVH